MVRRLPIRAALVLGATVLLSFAARPLSQGSAPAYALYLAETRRTLPFRTLNGVDFVSLDQIASAFGLTVTEDSLVGGLTVQGRGQTILLIPGQSFASIGPGRVVSLPAATQRDRNAWVVPVEFIRIVLGPALGQRVEVRRPTHVILVGDARLPQISGRFDRAGANARLTFEIQPPAPHRITRDGTRLVIKFDAVALDFSPVPGLAPEFATGVRTEGASITVELGGAVAGYRADDPDPSHLTIDLLAAGAPPPRPAPRPQTPEPAPSSSPPAQVPPPPPAAETPSSGGLRTVVIDPGHGGDDAGAKGAGGTTEKDFVLQMARRVKAAIESRFGLRVLLTRDSDDAVTLDRRIALANNNKADLFISLHANASVRTAARGAQVLSLNVADYRSQPDVSGARDLPVPVAGGGNRVIEIVPWDFAQVPHAERSAAVASALVRRLAEQDVPLYTRSNVRLPLRTLAGANMPAVMVELGFLTNADDEAAMNGAALQGALVDAILSTIDDVRRGLPEPAETRR